MQCEKIKKSRFFSHFGFDYLGVRNFGLDRGNILTWRVAKFYSKNIHVNFISQMTGKIEIQKVIGSIEKFKLKQK